MGAARRRMSRWEGTARAADCACHNRHEDTSFHSLGRVWLSSDTKLFYQGYVLWVGITCLTPETFHSYHRSRDSKNLELALGFSAPLSLTQLLTTQLPISPLHLHISSLFPAIDLKILPVRLAANRLLLTWMTRLTLRIR